MGGGPEALAGGWGGGTERREERKPTLETDARGFGEGG